MRKSFIVTDLLDLARAGADAITSDYRKDFKCWTGIIPGSESDTFDEIETALRAKFPDGVILKDIS